MPVITLASYKLTAIRTAVLMHLDGLLSNQVIDQANNYIIRNNVSPAGPTIVSDKTSSGTKSLRFYGLPQAAFYTTATTPFAFPGDFTIEFFMYPSANSGAGMVMGIGGIDHNNWQSQSLYYDSSGLLHWDAFSNPSTGGSSSSTTIAANATASSPVLYGQWNHIAITRSGTQYSVYLNGVRVIAVTSSLAPYSPTNPTILGNYPYTTSLNFPVFERTTPMDAYIDNWRVTKGVARYTGASFTVPTMPYQVYGADPYWSSVSSFLDMETINANGTPWDAGTGAAAWQYALPSPQSIYMNAKTNPFGGTTALQLDAAGGGWMNATNGALNLGTGDFTVEFWAWSTSSGAQYKSWFSTRYRPFNYTNGFSIGLNGQNMYVYADKFLIPLTGTFPLGRWNHIAMVKQGGVITLYLNGTAIGSSSGNNYNFSENRFGLGCNIDGSENWITTNTGSYMSELRVSKTARYTGTFTPPTAPLKVD